MTPQEYITQLTKLIEAGQDQEALDFSARFHRDVLPAMSVEELDLVSGALEGAAMAVSMKTSAVIHSTPAPMSEPTST